MVRGQPGQRRDLLHADEQQQPAKVAPERRQPVQGRRRQPARLPRQLAGGAPAGRATPTATSSACARTPAPPRRASPGTSTSSERRPTPPPAASTCPALTDDQDFSSPDGLLFTASTGMLLDPDRRRRLHRRHQLHDAGCGAGPRGRRRPVTLDYGVAARVTTRMGRKPTRSIPSSAFSSVRRAVRSRAFARHRMARWSSSAYSTRGRTRRSRTSVTRPSTGAIGRAMLAMAPAPTMRGRGRRSSWWSRTMVGASAPDPCLG